MSILYICDCETLWQCDQYVASSSDVEVSADFETNLDEVNALTDKVKTALNEIDKNYNTKRKPHQNAQFNIEDSIATMEGICQLHTKCRNILAKLQAHQKHQLLMNSNVDIEGSESSRSMKALQCKLNAITETSSEGEGCSDVILPPPRETDVCLRACSQRRPFKSAKSDNDTTHSPRKNSKVQTAFQSKNTPTQTESSNETSNDGTCPFADSESSLDLIISEKIISPIDSPKSRKSSEDLHISVVLKHKEAGDVIPDPDPEANKELDVSSSKKSVESLKKDSVPDCRSIDEARGDSPNMQKYEEVEKHICCCGNSQCSLKSSKGRKEPKIDKKTTDHHASLSTALKILIDMTKIAKLKYINAENSDCTVTTPKLDEPGCSFAPLREESTTDVPTNEHQDHILEATPEEDDIPVPVHSTSQIIEEDLTEIESSPMIEAKVSFMMPKPKKPSLSIQNMPLITINRGLVTQTMVTMSIEPNEHILSKERGPSGDNIHYEEHVDSDKESILSIAEATISGTSVSSASTAKTKTDSLDIVAKYSDCKCDHPSSIFEEDEDAFYESPRKSRGTFQFEDDFMKNATTNVEQNIFQVAEPLFDMRSPFEFGFYKSKETQCDEALLDTYIHLADPPLKRLEPEKGPSSQFSSSTTFLSDIPPESVISPLDIESIAGSSTLLDSDVPPESPRFNRASNTTLEIETQRSPMPEHKIKLPHTVVTPADVPACIKPFTPTPADLPNRNNQVPPLSLNISAPGDLPTISVHRDTLGGDAETIVEKPEKLATVVTTPDVSATSIIKDDEYEEDLLKEVHSTPSESITSSHLSLMDLSEKPSAARVNTTGSTTLRLGTMDTRVQQIDDGGDSQTIVEKPEKLATVVTTPDASATSIIKDLLKEVHSTPSESITSSRLSLMDLSEKPSAPIVNTTGSTLRLGTLDTRVQQIDDGPKPGSSSDNVENFRQSRMERAKTMGLFLKRLEESNLGKKIPQESDAGNDLSLTSHSDSDSTNKSRDSALSDQTKEARLNEFQSLVDKLYRRDDTQMKVSEERADLPIGNPRSFPTPKRKLDLGFHVSEMEKSASDGIVLDQSISEGEINCSASVGEIHACKYSTQYGRQYLKKHPENQTPITDKKLQIAIQRAKYNKWVNSVLRKKNLPPNDSSSDSGVNK